MFGKILLLEVVSPSSENPTHDYGQYGGYLGVYITYLLLTHLRIHGVLLRADTALRLSFDVFHDQILAAREASPV